MQGESSKKTYALKGRLQWPKSSPAAKQRRHIKGVSHEKVSKTAHHSLNELNITPLLDLAFVLLVIFIITTTPMVNDLDLNLPSASPRPKDAPRKPNYVTVDGAGKIYLNMKEVDLISLQQLIVLPDGIKLEMVLIHPQINRL